MNTYKVLAQTTLTGGTDTLYTVPASTAAIVKTIHVANYSADARTVKLLVGGTGDGNTILPTVSLAAGEFAQWDGTLALETGKTIVGVGSAASSIVVTISGDEIS